MSQSPALRRADKEMPRARAEAVLQSAYCGRIATVGADGMPYVCPMLFVWRSGEVWFHNTSAHGHLRGNIEHDARACFEVDEAGQAFPYGRFACDTALEYSSVVAIGTVRIVEAAAEKSRFFDALMARYHPEALGRPQGFYPRIDQVTVYAMRIDRLTGKETLLPAAQARWPARDQTRSPGATPRA